MYGSLVAESAAAEPAELPGFRAGWTVAMDNTVAIPGYKRYLDPATGAPPPVFVAFLAAVPDPAGVLRGVVRDVDEAELAALDRRERNYDRVEAGGVWLYAGSAEGRARAARGRAEGRLVVQRAYLELVRRGLAAVGAAAAEPDFPVLDLRLNLT